MKENTVNVNVRIPTSRRAWDFWCFSADYWRTGRVFIFTSALALPLGARLILNVANVQGLKLRVALAW